jgi:hypothetical protein
MSTTVFTGPVLAGNILNTNGTTPANANGSIGLQNVGFAQMAQVASITQSGGTTARSTAIVIPANSIIIDIYSQVTTAWGTTNTLSVGLTSAANELVTGLSMTQGQNTAAVTTLIANWNNVSTGQSTATDRQIYIKDSGTGTGGVGLLVVCYIQGWNGFTKGTTNTNWTA